MTKNQFPPEFEPFWQSLRHGCLSFPFCQDCERFHWYPMKHCPHCGSKHLDWLAVEGPGRIFTWTVVQHAFSEEFIDKVPYIVALIEFDDAPGVRLVSNIIDADKENIFIGARVDPAFPVEDVEQPPVVFRLYSN